MAQLDERAQMLLIGAIVLAVAFVSLAVVLNGSINTTTVASEASDGVSEREVLSFQTSVRRDVTTLMLEEYESGGTNSNQESDVEDHIDTRLNPAYKERHGNRGELVAVDMHDADPGSHVYQHSTGTFPDGEVTSNARVRQFDILVEGWGGGADEFTIEIDSETIVLRDDGSGGTEVVVNGVPACTDSSSHPTSVNITTGKVGGDYCPPLDVLDGTPVRVEFTHGNEIQGHYDLVTDDPGASGTNVDARLYSVELDLTYASSSSAYEGRIRLAPGEPR